MCLGIPGQVVGIIDDEGLRALVSVSGVQHEVSTAMLSEPGITVGEWVLIHVGFAMARVDEQEARTVIQEMQQLDDWYAAELGQDSA